MRRFLVLFLLCLMVPGQVLRRRLSAEPVSIGVAPPNGERLLPMIAAAGAKLAARPPAFSCSVLAASRRVERFRSSIDVTLGVRPPALRRYSDEIAVDLGAWVAEVFGSPLRVERWGTWNLRRVVVASYVGETRRTTVFADPDTGAILRVTTSGFPLPTGSKSLQCWVLNSAGEVGAR